jgi:hypothetical protein
VNAVLEAVYPLLDPRLRDDLGATDTWEPEGCVRRSRLARTSARSMAAKARNDVGSGHAATGARFPYRDPSSCLRWGPINTIGQQLASRPLAPERSGPSCEE